MFTFRPATSVDKRTNHKFFPPPTDTDTDFHDTQQSLGYGSQPMSQYTPVEAASLSACAHTAEHQTSGTFGTGSQTAVCPEQLRSRAPRHPTVRTKSELIEQKLEIERRHREQLSRDVRQALMTVSAHVLALPERWQQISACMQQQTQASGEHLSRLGADTAANVTQIVSKHNADNHKMYQELIAHMSECSKQLNVQNHLLKQITSNQRCSLDVVNSTCQDIKQQSTALNDLCERNNIRLESAVVDMKSAFSEISTALRQLSRSLTDTQPSTRAHHSSSNKNNTFMANGIPSNSIVDLDLKTLAHPGVTSNKHISRKGIIRRSCARVSVKECFLQKAYKCESLTKSSSVQSWCDNLHRETTNRTFHNRNLTQKPDSATSSSSSNDVFSVGELLVSRTREDIFSVDRRYRNQLEVPKTPMAHPPEPTTPLMRSVRRSIYTYAKLP